jgi:hypothetical protein
VNAASLKARFLLLGFLVAILAKFWLIWESEIADATDDPHEYVLQILYPSNGGLAYPPGTGLVGQFFYSLGIPFRLGLETAFLFATALVLRALIAWPWKTAVSLGLFVLLSFDPAVTELFSHLFSDEVWLVETLLGLSCFLLAIETGPKPHWGRLSLAILFLGLASITRSVLIPMLVSAIVFALLTLVLVLSKYRAPSLKPHLDLVALSVPSLIFGLTLIYASTCLFNSTHHGYSGISYLDSEQYKKFYLCLQSVGAPDGDPYFPIDENRRKLIAQAGPDSKWFIRELEANRVYKQVGLDHYGKYDIPAGWFHWAAFTAAMDPGEGNYLHAFSLFHSVEDEIAEASQHGIITVRPIISLPDARIPIVMATLPGGLHQAVRKTVREPSPDFFASLAQPSLYLSPEFNKALTRRAVTPSPERETIWRFLAHLYRWIYNSATVFLYVIVLVAFTFVLMLNWKRLPEFPLSLIAPLFFTIFFIVFFLWYALFDASGMPVLSRYMIFNHLLLFPLICRYLSMKSFWRDNLKSPSS